MGNAESFILQMQVSDAAEHLKVAPKKVRTWIRCGLIQSHIVDGIEFLRPRDVTKLISKRSLPSYSIGKRG